MQQHSAMDHTMVLAITTVASVLFAIATFFLRQFVSDVRALTHEVQQFKLTTHSRLSVLEAKNGVYNKETVQ